MDLYIKNMESQVLQLLNNRQELQLGMAEAEAVAPTNGEELLDLEEKAQLKLKAALSASCDIVAVGSQYLPPRCTCSVIVHIEDQPNREENHAPQRCHRFPSIKC